MTRARAVSFEARPAYSRLPHDDEKYVMKAFAKHASHCQACSNPYKTHLAGETLCSRGHRRALDVAQYVYVQAGNAYSVVDRNGRDGHRRQEVQIEIPAGCEAVRSLLRAMDRGLRVIREREEQSRRHDNHPHRVREHRRQSSQESMDSTYYVAPRPVVVEQSQRLERSTSNSSSDSHGSAASSRSIANSTSSRSSVESVPSSTLPASPRSPRQSRRSERNHYYVPAWGYETQPTYVYAQPLPAMYVPREHYQNAQPYYAVPGYQAPRYNGTAVWA